MSRPVVQAVGLVGAAPFIYWLGHASSSAAIFTALGVIGIFRGLYDSNLFASLYEVICPASRATATGLTLSAGFLIGGSSPVWVGKLSQSIGLGPALGATSVCYLVAGILMGLNAWLWFEADARRMREGLT